MKTTAPARDPYAHYYAQQKIMLRQNPRTLRVQRVVRWLSLANLLAVIVVTTGILLASEHWWLTHILTYLPRMVYLVPAFALLCGAALWRPRSALFNVLAIAIVVVPLMGFRVPWITMLERTSSSVTNDTAIVVASCNVQGYAPNFGAVLGEIGRMNPDVIALQEASGDHPLLAKWFADWHVVHEKDYLVASRFPVRLIGTSLSSVYDRPTAMQVEIDGPHGAFRLVNLHLMTARHALSEVSAKSVLTGVAGSAVEGESQLREIDALETREFVATTVGDMPLVIAGDFNTPSSSSLYRKTWTGLDNAFDTAGWGFGYTAPCSRHRFWFDNTPWLRIDHVLFDRRWTVSECRIGTGAGSDHRPIVARLQLRQP